MRNWSVLAAPAADGMWHHTSFGRPMLTENWAKSLPWSGQPIAWTHGGPVLPRDCSIKVVASGSARVFEQEGGPGRSACLYRNLSTQTARSSVKIRSSSFEIRLMEPRWWELLPAIVETLLRTTGCDQKEIRSDELLPCESKHQAGLRSWLAALHSGRGGHCIRFLRPGSGMLPAEEKAKRRREALTRSHEVGEFRKKYCFIEAIDDKLRDERSF
jgi:hypothetical protein